MTESNLKTRSCIKCKQKLPENEFIPTKSPYFPGHRSILCISCLERMVAPTNLNEVDRLCRHLDIPFNIDLWTRLYQTHSDHTLSAYIQAIQDDAYSSTSWAEENERWRIAREQKTIDEQISVLADAEKKRLLQKWSDNYDMEELLFLEEFYNKIIATQNVSTPILQEYARDLCEIELRIKKGLRAGIDVKKDMDARDNIIKIAKFDASNSKNSADFESIGELMVYYGKQGFHPKWHQEPQDSVDFCMKNIQSYLKRLVVNEGSLAEQVEDKRRVFNTTQRIEEMEDEEYVEEEEKVEFEDEDAIAQELSDFNA